MKILAASLFLSIFLTFPSLTFAHALGQPPYLKVNGIFTEYYPVPATSLTDFVLPQDIVLETFVVNEEINFEVDVKALPMPEEIVNQSKFLWDFSDGTKGEGLNITHSFNKPGTYFVDLKTDSQGGFEAQTLQITAINVLPYEGYELPKVVIEVNHKGVSDPLLDVIDVDFSKKQLFSGSKSTGGSSEITEYFWDLGNTISTSGTDLTFKYDDNPYTVFPVLRIKTQDGFVADAFVQIRDGNSFDSPADEKWNLKVIFMIVLGLVIVGLLLILVVHKIFRGKNKNG